jgi:FlgN protein
MSRSIASDVKDDQHDGADLSAMTTRASAGPGESAALDTETRLTRLAEILEQEGRHYEMMAALSLSVRASLVHHDIESLRRTVAEQEELIARVDALERERAETVAILTERFGGSGRPMTIGEILAMAREPERDRLRRLRERVLSEIHRIQKISETNAYLIESSLEVVEGELSLFAGRDEVAYDRDGGNVAGVEKNRILDRKA